jgi:hypothetical protein
MATKADLIQDSEGTWAKIGHDEEVFILRAQDISSPKVVLCWIEAQMYNQNISDQKLREAFETALKMRQHGLRKAAD